MSKLASCARTVIRVDGVTADRIHSVAFTRSIWRAWVAKRVAHSVMSNISEILSGGVVSACVAAPMARL
jgi:hypothetical protein